MIPNPVKLSFNPKTQCECFQALFDDAWARTLWLAWRPEHVVSQYFIFECWELSRRLRLFEPPITAKDIASCLKGRDFMACDVARWADEAVKFFLFLQDEEGGEELRFVVEKKPTAETNAMHMHMQEDKCK